MSFLGESTRAALARLAEVDADAVPEVDDAPAAPGVALDRLRAIRSLIAELEADPATLNSVRAALAAGAEWPQIAEASGLKPAAAKWRWQGDDSEIAARLEAGRKRSARPSSVPTELPGYSVADAAQKLGVTAQAIYLQVSRGKLRAETVELADGRKYKRVFFDEVAIPPAPSNEPE